MSSSTQSSSQEAVSVNQPLITSHETTQSKPPEETSFDIDYVIDHKLEGNVNFYLIKWKHYPKRSATWEPEDHFDSTEAIEEFWLGRRRSPSEQPQPPLQQRRNQRQKQKPTKARS